MADTSNIATLKVATIVSWVLSVYGNVKYLVGRSPYDKHSPFNVGDTPFTANIIVILAYWGFMYLLQILFVLQIFLRNLNDYTTRSALTQSVGWHFTVFNLFSFVWSLLFARKHFFWSEVILILNLFNIWAVYLKNKTYKIKPLWHWILVHLPISAFPFSWLLYAIFWNGAVLFHVHKFVGRVVSNVLIWDFLLAPGFYLVVYNDWGIGISSAWITFGLGLGQFFTKVFALQWIFAFVIAGLLFVASIVAAVVGGFGLVAVESDEVENAPLLQGA
mgnify:CR=1 FL=1